MPTEENITTVPICGICKKSCTEPKFLPCQHAFCKICLKFNISKVPTNRQWEGFSCPFCKTYTKAIDPDEFLHLWADQFPDKLVPKKRRSRASVTSIESPRPDTITEPSSPKDKPSLSSFPSLSSSISEEPVSPLKALSDLDSPLKADAGAFPESITENPENSETDVQDNVVEDEPETKGVSKMEEQTQERRCLIHPWKPLIIFCSSCDSEACGQCLTESHASCKAETFSPLEDAHLFPDISDLEEEARNLNDASEKIKQSRGQILQSKDQIVTKIRNMAQQMVQDIKREEVKMVNKVKRLYRQEILRLQSGIEPCEGLFKEVKQLKQEVEQLTNHHPTVVLEKADDVEEKQRLLLEKLRVVDLACQPPDVDFVKDFDILTVNLGNLVVDSGSYPKFDIPEPKYDIPENQVEERTETNKQIPESPEDVPASAEAAGVDVDVTKTVTTEVTEVTVTQTITKSKSQTLIGRLLSHTPKGTLKQDKPRSKFFVKTPKR